MTRLYYPRPDRPSHFEYGPFHWSANYGESSAGVRIDGSGAGVYNVLRPRWPTPINDGSDFQMQSRVRSRLNLDQGLQGFGSQARAFHWDGTTDAEEVWRLDPDEAADILWYSRQDPDFLLATANLEVPKGKGATHLVIEPLIHAASGYCDITSVTLRSLSERLTEHESLGESWQLSTGGNLRFERYMYTQNVDINKGEELSPTIAAEVRLAYQAFGVTATLKMRRFDGTEDYSDAFAVAVLGAQDLWVPLDGGKPLIADHNYNRVQLVLESFNITGGTAATLDGRFYTRGLKFKLNRRQVLRSGV